MNRRDFVKALAGLLGLLVKVPEAEEEGSYTFGDSALYEAAYAELQAGAEEQPPYEIDIDYDEAEDWLVTSYKDENGEWQRQVIIGTPPANLHWNDDSPPGVSYWDGKEWADILTRWSNDITNAAAQKVDDGIMKT